MMVAMVSVARVDAATWTAGAKGGVNWGDLGGDNAPENTSARAGFQGGAFARCNPTEQFGVQAEILYVQKGAEGDFLTEDLDIHPATYKLDYIDIPIVFVANFPAGDKLGFNVFGGPSFNFNTGATADVEEHGTIDLNNVKSFEFGAVIGAGLAYELSSMSLIADVRYSLGASPVVDDVGGQSVDAKNRGIGLMAGLSFPLGGK
jgi:hypothetical protein